MKNEFDDELNRETKKRVRRGYDSKPDPSDGDYYLDDDYEDFEDRKSSGANHNSRDNGGSQPVRRAPSSSKAGSTGQTASRQSQTSGNAKGNNQPSDRKSVV